MFEKTTYFDLNPFSFVVTVLDNFKEKTTFKETRKKPLATECPNWSHRNWTKTYESYG